MSEDRPDCLLLHGLGGGPYEFGPLIEALETHGLRVSAPTFPGHVEPGPNMPHSRWTEWAACADDAYQRLASGGRPIAVVGFSTGGTIALRMASQKPVARLVLLAPFFAIRYMANVPLGAAWYVKHLAKLMPDLPRRRPPVADPVARKQVAQLERYRTFSLPSTLSALELIRLTQPLVPSILTPTLICQGRRDSVVDPAQAASLAASLGSRLKRLVWLERSDHLVALDYDRELLCQEVLRFLRDGNAS